MNILLDSLFDFSSRDLLAVMMAAVIDIINDDQRDIVRRLFRESGNVNVKTIDVREEINLHLVLFYLFSQE